MTYTPSSGGSFSQAQAQATAAPPSIVLDTTSTSLEIVLTSAVANNQSRAYVSYEEVTSTTFAYGKNDTVTNGVTPVTLLAAPAASTQRRVTEITLRNADTSNIEVTVNFKRSATLTPLCKITLAPGSQLKYSIANGFEAKGDDGVVNTVVGTDTGGRYLRTRVISSSGGAIPFHPSIDANAIMVELIGGGGGGGGVLFVASGNGAAAGGGSGGYARKFYAVAPFNCTINVGAAGTAGSAAGSNGGAGGDTTFTDGTTLVTAKGGGGGLGQTCGTTEVMLSGGTAGAISTNGDLNIPGNPGRPAYRRTATFEIATSGTGGSSVYGSGGAARSSGQGQLGNAGAGFGAGGAGATSVGGNSQTGGAGAAGAVIVTEYT